jgi:hypothetical protein
MHSGDCAVRICAAFQLSMRDERLKLASRGIFFYEHHESIRSGNIKLQNCAVIAINFVRARS